MGIQAKIQWQAALDLETRRWIAICPALNLNAVGDTYKELTEAAIDAMDALFADLYESGELDRFLTVNGWTLVNTPEGCNTPEFDVPFNLEQTRIEGLTTAYA